MAKRKAANGNGTISKRADGRYEGRYVVGYDPGTGKQIRKSVYGKTQTECAKKLREAINAVDTGSYIEPTKITVAQWLDIWHREYLGNVKQSTAASYKSHIETHIKPNIGAVKLLSLKSHQVQKLYNNALRTEDNPDGMSAKNIKNLHGVLHKAMKQAVILGYIRSNPTEGCVLPRVEKKEVAFLEEDQIRALLDAISGHQFEDVYKVTLFTGLRQGEALGLTWDCVNFDAGVITVSKQLQKEKKAGGEYRLTSCKTDKVRRISPAPFVMDILRQQRIKQNEVRLRAGGFWSNEWNLVFTNEIGGHLCHHTVYKHFKKIVKELGLPDVRFHDMRHTYAVISIQNGDDIKTVQANVGHATAAFTLDVYGHVSQRMQKESANRMQNYIKELKSTS
ncbi:MAG: site-specific integrase [Clostridia bacterium]|nr:site-specific integrase [Clostridia bacterium]